MSKQSRLLVFAVSLAFAILLWATIWKQLQLEQARVVRIEITHKQMLTFTTTPPSHQKWVWSGTQTQFISDQLKFDNAGCIGPTNGLRSLDEISIKVIRQEDKPITFDFDPQTGITRADKNHCKRLLTPQSLKYLRELMVQTPPNVK